MGKMTARLCGVLEAWLVTRQRASVRLTQNIMRGATNLAQATVRPFFTRMAPQTRNTFDIAERLSLSSCERSAAWHNSFVLIPPRLAMSKARSLLVNGPI